MNKKGIITIGILLTGFLTLPFSSYALIKLTTASQIFEKIKDIPVQDRALVLGAAAYPSRLSDILQDRVNTVVELYKAGKINEIIMSGGKDESAAMKGEAMRQGVPGEKIMEDPNGLNTMASFQNVEDTEKSLIIVTQKYHLPRSLFIAGSKGIEAVGMIADKQPYLDIEEYKKRELWATSKAVYDVYFGR